MSNEPLQINLKEEFSANPIEYDAFVALILGAMMSDSEEKIKFYRKTIVETFRERGINLEQVVSVDNQIFMTANAKGTQIYAYLCDKPKTYDGKPAIARNFEVRKKP
jgi:hypothetical protein